MSDSPQAPDFSQRQRSLQRLFQGESSIRRAQTTAGRIDAIDSARGIAVLLATVSHAPLQFAAEVDHVRILTRTATPAFMIILGATLGIVYLRRLRAAPDASARSATVGRLIARMLLCYVLFGMITFAAVLTGKLEPDRGVAAMLFLWDGRFGAILRTYAVLFAPVLLALPLRMRHGAAAVLWAAAGAWALKFGADGLGLAPLGPLLDILGHSYGYGPAVLPGLTFVAFGMLVGEALTGRRDWSAAAALLAAQAAAIGPGPLAGMILDHHRWTNDPLHYAFGIAAMSLVLLILRGLWQRPAPDPGSRSRSLARLGRDTLFVYGFGNVALNLLPVHEGGADAGLGLTAAFLFALCAVSLDAFGLRSRSDRAMMHLPARAAALYRRAAASAIARAAEALTPAGRAGRVPSVVAPRPQG